MSSTTEREEFMTAAQAAQYLTVSLPWLRLKTSTGEIPHSKLGRRVVYERSELARWVREQQATRP
jgi:excisionase family DNA binding protein